MANGIDDRGTLLKYKNDFQGRQFCTTNIEFLFFFFLFFPNVKMASGKAFWDHSQSIWWILGTSEFFHPQLWRWLKGVAFVERRNRVVGGALGSFSIDLMGFWTIEFFSPSTLGVAAGGSFCRSLKSLCGRCFLNLNSQSIWRVFGPSMFFIPNFGGGCTG